MAVLCRPHRLLFLLNPRTAGSAVARTLVDELDGEWLPAEDIVDEQGRVVFQAKHNTVPDLLGWDVLQPADLDGLTVFTTVRNPFDSMVSLYLKLRERYRQYLDDPGSWLYLNPRMVEMVRYCQDHGFGQWVRRYYWRSALATLLKGARHSINERYLEHTTHVMRFEHLQEDFDQVLRDAGVDRRVEIARFNPTENKTRGYRDYYDPVARWIIATTFRDDIRRFNATF